MPKTISFSASISYASPVRHMQWLSLITALFFFLMSVVGAQAQTQTPLRKLTPTPAPNIAFSGDKGQTYTLSQWRGKVVVVNLWATWCTPCITEMPSLNEFSARMKPRGVSVIPLSIGQDSPAKIQEFFTKYGLNTMNVARDLEHSALRAFGVSGLPSSFIIDKQGNLVGQIDGATNWNDVQLNAYIKFLLN